MDNNFIVTGGAGFIGSNLVEELARKGNVLVFDNLHTGSRENLDHDNPAISFSQGDSKEISKMNTKPDTIFHLGIYSASPMYRENPMLVGEVINGMISVLELARKSDSNVVFASTSSIYNGIKPPHGENVIPGVTDYYTEARIGAERMSELYNKLYGINVAAMRFFSVYGYHEDAKRSYANLATQFYKSMKKDERPVIYGDGTQRRDFVFVTDVVRALILASSVKGYDVFNVGSGKNYSLLELVEKINRLLGKSIEPEFVEMPVKNYVMETLADTSKAEKLLGFKAEVSLDEGLKKLNSYYGGS